MAHWRAVLGPRLIDVDLAAWVDDFSATLDRVLGFLELPHDPACARFHEQTRRVRTASAGQVRRPINRDGIGRFRPYAQHLEPLFVELDRAGLIAWSEDDMQLRVNVDSLSPGGLRPRSGRRLAEGEPLKKRRLPDSAAKA
jgi:hypothetical protein